jgi:hypothetical protein
VRDVDGVNVWPLLTGANRTQPRSLTPTSEVAIIDTDAPEVTVDQSITRPPARAHALGSAAYCGNVSRASGIPRDSVGHVVEARRARGRIAVLPAEPDGRNRPKPSSLLARRAPAYSRGLFGGASFVPYCDL